MVTYGDYFSRKTLYYCGISPDKDLSIKDEYAYNRDNRKDLIASDMKEIYQTFLNALGQKQVESPLQEAEKLCISGKIVSAFYDFGVLSEPERTFFQSNFPQTSMEEPERERIVVEEANSMTNAPAKSEKVAPAVKNMEIRNVLQ